MGLLVILIALLGCLLIHLALFALCGALFGAKAQAISLFVGPRLLGKKFAGIEYSLRVLPFGAYVKFEKTSFELRNLFQKAVIIIGGCVFLLLLSAIVLGRSVAMEMFVAGFAQIFSGAVSPLDRGASLANQAMALALSVDFLTAFCGVATKFVAVQLLPFPTFNGGQLILCLLDPSSRWSESTLITMFLVSIGMSIVLGTSWIVAFTAALS